MVRSVYREIVQRRKAMLMAFSLRKGKAKTSARTIRRSPVPRAEGHQQNMNYPIFGLSPHSGHTAPIPNPARS
jgi:hypothetical protein